MKIILCGKGGCGKSTVATLLARAYQREGKNVLVIDSDESNYGLHRQLGFELPEDFTHFFGGKKGAYRVFDEKGKVFDNRWHLSDIPERFLSGEEGLHLMAVGKIAEAEEGCACGIGFTGKMFLDNLETGEDDIVITDTEAGVEHFGRGLDRCADVILMVVDPSYESIHLSEKIYDMGKALDKPVLFVINKADGEQAAIVRETIRDKGAVIAEIPSHTGIMMAGLKGEPLNCDCMGVHEIINKLCEFK
ncbi:MAG: P-loop NTPase [Oscillospiraceae bacterium]|nr:P-loop NTPase [Oscillospiraceae bacterium]